MNGTFDSTPVIDGLKSFQRATVDHVCRRFYEDEPAARRFLVADETGLGKSLVARGVIARTIKHLQHDDTVDRIDIVYVCSNADIAEQNLKRLDVLGSGAASHHSTRLTLLARDCSALRGDPDPGVGKRVNLVSFTPGTSFELGFNTGRADERALLHVILCDALGLTSRRDRRAAAVVLRASSQLPNFERDIERIHYGFEADKSEPDTSITKPFLRAIRRGRLRERFEEAVASIALRTKRTEDERVAHSALIGELRSALAKAGVDALEPDLVILDEFQRFRHLLETDDARLSEAAELAHTLFDHGEAKVLLLSATPYKPFTYAEEAAGGDDHEADLRRTLEFLAGAGGATSVTEKIVTDLAAFRRAAVDGADVSAIRRDLEGALTSLMCRTERPRLGDDGMLAELCTELPDVNDDDLVSYAMLRRLAVEVGGPMSVEYWKSTPYFLNFGDTYKLGTKLQEALQLPEERERLRPMLRDSQRISSNVVRRLEPLEPGNARMRFLAKETIEQDWWKLLWTPPSLPYYEPRGPYADPRAQHMTKRLIFSSWTATPTAIAALLSYEATRRLAGSRDALERALSTRRLDWRLEDRRPAAMTTLALFWPSPGLAGRTTPFDPAPSNAVDDSHTGGEQWYWTSLFEDPASIPQLLDEPGATAAMSGNLDDDPPDEPTRLASHVELAFAINAGTHDVGSERRTWTPPDLDSTLLELGRFAPGNIAYRCLGRLLAAEDTVTPEGHWRAAAVLSAAFRSLFNRADSMLLLDQLLPDVVYWRAVLRYCAWGNLEAVLDEYLHHLSATDRPIGLDDERLTAIAAKASEAITPRPSRYQAFDPLQPGKRIDFTSRFALRYGNKRGTEDDNHRQPQIRDSFNSPFWPFVLATTSIGQEGIDLHWWCHAAVHWNTPASPVDFEQREGRVHRFGGHAIRRNLAETHAAEILTAAEGGEHPWDAAYRLGEKAATDAFGDLAPYWITSGSTKIQRHVLPYPLSKDIERYRRLKDDLAVYRLTFGQPRQEDLAELLKQRGVHLDVEAIEALRLDLRPPKFDRLA